MMLSPRQASRRRPGARLAASEAHHRAPARRVVTRGETDRGLDTGAPEGRRVSCTVSSFRKGVGCINIRTAELRSANTLHPDRAFAASEVVRMVRREWRAKKVLKENNIIFLA